MSRPIVVDHDEESVTLTWPTAQLQDANSDSLGYDLEWHQAVGSDDCGEVSSAGQTAWHHVKVSGKLVHKKHLVPGATYVFRVKPEEHRDFGEELMWTHPTAAPGAGSANGARPSAPRVTRELMPHDAGLSSALIEWRDPLNCSNYEVQKLHIDGSAADWVTISKSLSQPSVVHRDLPAQAPVLFRWRGQTAQGWGRWSASSLNTTAFNMPCGSVPAGVTQALQMDNAAVRSVGPMLLSHKGIVSTASVVGKVLLLYFSADWCVACRQYTSMLVQFYEQMRALGKPIEVVFVSADQTPETFHQYFASMPWLAVPYASPVREELRNVHQVLGIPALKVLSSVSGRVVDDDAVHHQLDEATFSTWEASCAGVA